MKWRIWGRNETPPSRPGQSKAMVGWHPLLTVVKNRTWIGEKWKLPGSRAGRVPQNRRLDSPIQMQDALAALPASSLWSVNPLAWAITAGFLTCKELGRGRGLPGQGWAKTHSACFTQPRWQIVELWSMENKASPHLHILKYRLLHPLVNGKGSTEENHQDPSHTMNSHITHLYLQNNEHNVPSAILSTRLQGWLRHSPTWVGTSSREDRCPQS